MTITLDHHNVPLVEELRKALGSSTVLTPESDGYAESIRRWSESAERKAGIVVYAGSAADVSATILFCRKHAIEMAVCGGGHSTGGGSSSTGGLVLDLRKLHAVAVDAEHRTVTAQGGCVWKHVDEAAGEHGLATVGGTVNHTGIGGLTLGGGYGWLSGLYGLTIDNLLKVTVVLADGSIATASQTENPDLFWALRGAGQCFGVAVEFTYRAYDQANAVWAGQLAFPAEEKLDAVVAFANHLSSTTQGECGMIMGLTAPPFLNGAIAVVANVFYNGAKEDAERRFAPLLKLAPVMDTTAQRPYCTVNGMMNEAVGYGGRRVLKGSSFVPPVRQEFVRGLMDDLRQLHRTVPGSSKSLIIFEFFNRSAWCKVPLTATAYANRGQYQNVMTSAYCQSAEHDNACRLWAREVARKCRVEFRRALDEFGMLEAGSGEYGNYDGLSANPRDIFGVNYERLTQLKARYDPDNVFNKSYPLLPAQSGSFPGNLVTIADVSDSANEVLLAETMA